MKLLIVDDHALIRDALRSVLRELVADASGAMFGERRAHRHVGFWHLADIGAGAIDVGF